MRLGIGLRRTRIRGIPRRALSHLAGLCQHAVPAFYLSLCVGRGP
jgi:hypothetical protein